MSSTPPFRAEDRVEESATIDYVPPAETFAAADSPAWRAHQAVSQFMEEQISTVDAQAVPGAGDFAGSGNVIGVGVGTSMPESADRVAEPGVPSLRVYLLEPMEESAVRDVLARDLGAEDADLQDIPVEPVVTGEIRAFPHTFRDRPAPGGISVGHVDITAGTLGCLARGRSGDRRERRLVLSNNHVLADSNNGSFGDAIVQPGPVDGGTMPGDQIAILERFVPISFTGSNQVDCATGWADPALVRRELVYLDGGAPRYFRIDSRPRRARVGDNVGKSGRTTQITGGRVTNVSATIRVRFGPRVALFRNQIEIVPLNPASGPFSRGGDSGSVIFTMDAERLPVGLLFAGGGNSTFANHMDDVLAALDIELVT